MALGEHRGQDQRDDLPLAHQSLVDVVDETGEGALEPGGLFGGHAHERSIPCFGEGVVRGRSLRGQSQRVAVELPQPTIWTESAYVLLYPPCQQRSWIVPFAGT